MAGHLPVVPRDPPALLPGQCAETLMNRAFVKIAAAVFGVIVLATIVKRSGVPYGWGFPVVFGAGAVTFWLMVRWPSAAGRRNYEEFQHGYTTLQLKFGTFQGTRDLRWWVVNWRIPWDYSGLWTLRPDGSVVSAPAFDRDPPGFYPSPHRPGRDELWTGCAWAGYYRADRDR